MKIQGINIREVWDYRLSIASVFIDRRGGTWVCVVASKSNPDYVPAYMVDQEFEQLLDDDGEAYDGAPIEGTGRLIPATDIAKPLETYDTKIEVTKGDTYDTEKIKACYKWFLSVRDKYARTDIEELKPKVAKINKLNAELAAKGAV